MTPIVHIFPVNDVVDHNCKESTVCICNPQTRLVICPDGTDAIIVIHDAIDGRKTVINEEDSKIQYL